MATKTKVDQILCFCYKLNPAWSMSNEENIEGAGDLLIRYCSKRTVRTVTVKAWNLAHAAGAYRMAKAFAEADRAAAHRARIMADFASRIREVAHCRSMKAWSKHLAQYGDPNDANVHAREVYASTVLELAEVVGMKASEVSVLV